MLKRTAYPALALLIIAAATAACSGGKGPGGPTGTVTAALPSGTPAPVTLEIVSPAAGSTVKSPITLQIGASGIRVADWSLRVPGAVHFDALVDKEPVAEGKVTPSGTGIFHLFDATLQIPLAAGQHKIIVVLGDNDHVRVKGVPTAEVTFTVGK